MSALKRLIDQQRERKAVNLPIRETPPNCHAPVSKLTLPNHRRPSDTVLDELFDADEGVPAAVAPCTPKFPPIHISRVLEPTCASAASATGPTAESGRKQSSSPLSVGESPVQQEFDGALERFSDSSRDGLDESSHAWRRQAEKRTRSPSPPVEVIDVISPPLAPATTLQPSSRATRRFRPPRRKDTPVSHSSASTPVIHLDDDEEDGPVITVPTPTPSADLDETYAREIQAQEFGFDDGVPVSAPSYRGRHPGSGNARTRYWNPHAPMYPIPYDVQRAARGYRVGGYGSAVPPFPFDDSHDPEFPQQRNLADVLMQGERNRGRRNRRRYETWEGHTHVAQFHLGGVGGVPAIGLDLMTRELTAEDYERLLALDEGHKKHKAATVTDLSMLPTHVASEAELASGSQEDNTCCVCLSTIDVGDVVKRLPCLHAFHADCIDGWLKVNATCPIDKTTVFE